MTTKQRPLVADLATAAALTSFLRAWGVASTAFLWTVRGTLAVTRIDHPATPARRLHLVARRSHPQTHVARAA